MEMEEYAMLMPGQTRRPNPKVIGEGSFSSFSPRNRSGMSSMGLG